MPTYTMHWPGVACWFNTNQTQQMAKESDTLKRCFSTKCRKRCHLVQTIITDHWGKGWGILNALETKLPFSGRKFRKFFFTTPCMRYVANATTSSYLCMPLMTQLTRWPRPLMSRSCLSPLRRNNSCEIQAGQVISTLEALYIQGAKALYDLPTLCYIWTHFNA